MDLEGKTGNLYPYLEELGVTGKVEFKKLPNVYRSVFPDFEITLPVGRENIEGVLLDNFPKRVREYQRFSTECLEPTKP